MIQLYSVYKLTLDTKRLKVKGQKKILYAKESSHGYIIVKIHFKSKKVQKTKFIMLI